MVATPVMATMRGMAMMRGMGAIGVRRAGGRQAEYASQRRSMAEAAGQDAAGGEGAAAAGGSAGPSGAQKVLAGVLVAISAAMGAATYQALNPEKPVLEAEEGVDPSNPFPELGGAFDAVSTADGAPVVTEADLLGKLTLLYFGFTHCPDICPTELTKLSKALRRLETVEPELARHVQLVFASVDPPRDTLELMRKYVAGFHQRLVGWTGSDEQMARLAKAYKVYVRALSADEMAADDYVIDHSMFTYLVSPEGHVVELFGADNTPAQIADAIFKWKPSLAL